MTGSIGVYGVLTTIENLYDWAGIQVDGVSSTDAANWDPRFEMPENVTSAIQASVDDIYDKFVNKVLLIEICVMKRFMLLLREEYGLEKSLTIRLN